MSQLILCILNKKNINRKGRRKTDNTTANIKDEYEADILVHKTPQRKLAVECGV